MRRLSTVHAAAAADDDDDVDDGHRLVMLSLTARHRGVPCGSHGRPGARRIHVEIFTLRISTTKFVPCVR